MPAMVPNLLNIPFVGKKSFIPEVHPTSGRACLTALNQAFQHR